MIGYMAVFYNVYMAYAQGAGETLLPRGSVEVHVSAGRGVLLSHKFREKKKIIYHDQ